MKKQLRITNIKWDRIYLHLTLQGDTEGCTFSLRETTSRQVYLLEHKGDTICVNITCVTNVKGNEMLPTGEWQLLYEKGGTERLLLLSEDAAAKLEACDKLFPYWNDCYAYTVRFEPREADGGLLYCVMKTVYMRANKKPHKEYILLEAAGFSKRCKKLMVLIVERIYQLLYTLLSRIRKKDDKHILFMSETKKEIAGNLKAIDRRIKERGLEGEIKVSYSFHETLNISSLAVAAYWLKLICKLAKQDFVFIDDYAPVFKFLNLDKRTKLVQVWHAGLGFKSVGYSRFGKENSPRPLNSCHRNYDFVIVGSENLIPVYQEVFGLGKEKFLPYGVPRVDDFLNAEQAEEYQTYFYEEYPKLKNRKIIVFAPTYRGAGQTEAYYPYDKLNLKALYEFCGQEYVFVFKMHPFIKVKPEIPDSMRDRIFDFSQGNMNDMLRICDILITDYSSVIYEYVLLDKPILFYAFDKEAYRTIRGFHWDYDKYAPGSICNTFEELMEALEQGRFREDRRQAFKDFGYEHIDAHSSDRVIDRLLLRGN